MAGLEDYMNIVSDAHQKTASSKNAKSVNTDLLSKLAMELEPKAGEMAQAEDGSESQMVAADAAASVAGAGGAGAEAQGGVKPAASSVAGANPAVVSATEAVATPQVVATGGNPAESAAGEMAAPVKPNEGLAISAGDGKVTDANNFGKEPGAVMAAAEVEKSAELKRAEEIGVTMANAYVQQLEKISEDNQYAEALEYLESRDMLSNYTINDRPKY